MPNMTYDKFHVVLRLIVRFCAGGLLVFYANGPMFSL